MSSDNSRANDSREPVQQFFELLPMIPTALRRACHRCRHTPNKMEFDGFVQRVTMALLNKDYKAVRSFKHRSSSETWLQKVATNLVIRDLRQRKRTVSLGDLSSDALVSAPTQEELIYSEERKQALVKALSKLTKRERRLFELLCQDDLSMAEIAALMGIELSYLYESKHNLIRKLQKLLQKRGGEKTQAKRSEKL